MNTTKSKLTLLLESMIFQANQKTHVPIKRSLKSGLTIIVTADHEGVTMVLTREEAAPGENEFQTILKHFPYEVVGYLPARPLIYNGKRALIAQLPHKTN